MKNVSVIAMSSKVLFISYLPTQIKGKTVLHAIKFCFTPILLYPLQNVDCDPRLKHSNQPIYISNEILLKYKIA